MPTITCLSGTLVRQDDGSWQWSDGQAEPRVRDLSPDEWNFRCRTYGNGQCYVEVLRGVAQESQSLAWVIAGKYDWSQSSLLHGNESRGLILVPIAEWDAWVKAAPAGAAWDLTNETGILDQAYALGWRPARRYKARDTGKVYK